MARDSLFLFRALSKSKSISGMGRGIAKKVLNRLEKSKKKPGKVQTIRGVTLFQTLEQTGKLIGGEQKAVSRATRKRRLLAQRTSNFGSKKTLG